MPARIVGSFERIIATLEQEGGRIRRAVTDGIEAEAREIQRIAKLMVPIDERNMEHAIKVSNAQLRRRWNVYVDEDMPDDTGEWTAGDYLTFLHEGDYKLGLKSLSKETGGQYRVGPKFLERAFQAQQAGALERIRRAAIKAGVLN